MDLKTISHVTTWGNAASDINNNFEVIKEAIKSEDKEYALAKGLFKTLEYLKEAYPYPEIGDWAYVGTGFPAKYYTWNGTEWELSEDQKQPEDVSLEGYIQSEYVNDVTKILY